MDLFILAGFVGAAVLDALVLAVDHFEHGQPITGHDNFSRVSA